MASGAGTLKAIAAVSMILLICSQGEQMAAGEAIPCSQCASQCSSSSIVAFFTMGPCKGVCKKDECVDCRREATKRCQDRCFGGCGGNLACPGCRCQWRCNCREIVEFSCDMLCRLTYSQACRDCRQNCVADCTRVCKTNCLSG